MSFRLDTEMSGIGGVVRLGELTGPWPIRHALQIGICGEKFVYRDESDATPRYRWPANRYRMPTNGQNPELEMGALLALPPNLSAEGLGCARRWEGSCSRRSRISAHT